MGILQNETSAIHKEYIYGCKFLLLESLSLDDNGLGDGKLINKKRKKKKIRSILFNILLEKKIVSLYFLDLGKNWLMQYYQTEGYFSLTSVTNHRHDHFRY